MDQPDRKMFIGGLNWETTDRESTRPSCLCGAVILLTFERPKFRVTEGILLTIWRSTRMHGDARWRQWEVAWFWLLDVQGSQNSQHSDGQRALLRWQDSKIPIEVKSSTT